MKIKKGDTIVITVGKDRGKTGKVARAIPQEGRIVVDGLNLRKRHVRPRREGEKGQIVSIPSSFDISNAKLVCPKCKKAARVGYRLENDKKVRVCKQCQATI